MEASSGLGFGIMLDSTLCLCLTKSHILSTYKRHVDPIYLNNQILNKLITSQLVSLQFVNPWRILVYNNTCFISLPIPRSLTHTKCTSLFFPSSSHWLEAPSQVCILSRPQPLMNIPTNIYKRLIFLRDKILAL